ncbi:MAG: hypothetical protein AAF656_09295 [Planctomycetota bacterium]
MKSIATILALSTTVAVASAEVLYEETFPNDTDAGVTLATVGWQIALGPKAEDATNYQQHAVSEGAGVDGDAGFALNFYGEDFWDRTTLYWTDEFDGEVAAEARFTWHEAGSDPLHAALCVDGTWYVNTAAGEHVPGDVYDFANVAVERSVELGGEGWHVLNFVPGRVLEVGDAVDALPAGQVTGLGLFAAEKTGVQAFDSVRLVADVDEETED